MTSELAGIVGSRVDEMTHSAVLSGPVISDNDEFMMITEDHSE